MAQSTQAAYRKPRFAGPAILVDPEGLYSNSDTRKFSLGQLGYDTDGNAYRYVQAAEALAEGQAVSHVARAAWDSGILVDGAVTAGDTLIHVDNITTAVAADFYAGYYIGQAGAATGLGALHKIKSHPALTASGEADIFLDVSTPAKETIANNTALEIFHPWRVELIDATTKIIRGIVVNTIDSGNYGWIQVGGYVPSVLVGHSTSAAIVIDEPLVPVGSALAGSLQGYDATTPSEANILQATRGRLFANEAVSANVVARIDAYIVGML